MSTQGSSKARRLLYGLWHSLARRGLLAAALLANGAGAQADILGAEYAEPTTRYAHGVLGDAVEYGTLVIHTDRMDGLSFRMVLPETRVFEDVAPRLADVDGDGDVEVIVVESEASTGAQLAIYDDTGKIAATPHIGTRNRWLAPIGAVDLDGDGHIEIAYIDRPHLAKTLRVWRYRDGALTEIAQLGGLTNHRIGERDIGGGIRDCGQGFEMITASANWRQVMSTTLKDGQLATKPIGTDTSRAGLNAALACK